MKYKIKDIKLAKAGKNKIAFAEKEMPVLRQLAADFKNRQPFAGVNISACLHVTKETAVLVNALTAGGANVSLAGSNPLSTQDDVAAALALSGVKIFAWRGIHPEKYYWCLGQVLDSNPQITIDDGADLISLIHKSRKSLIKTVWAGQEETTTGVIRLRAMAKAGKLKYPVVAVNDTPTKHMFDNYYGTGQSTLDGLLRATNILLSGKSVVVAGYGYCGKGIALRAKGLGARVIVTEVDPLPALQAAMDGFEVMPMTRAARIGDVFLTATGNKDVITRDHFKLMKDGAILGNSGHFNVEINISHLNQISSSRKQVRDNLMEFTTKYGRKLYLISEGRLMNLAAAEGHPSAVMDMSFADQALTAEWLVKNHQNLKNEVYNVPKEIDEKVSQLKLQSLGVKIDVLTPGQKKYLASWTEGT
ncbi:MAG: adenosylhomocysteinase [Candidatus Doudnabacteria bacterium]|nr:adenosylhomocysteinase [Candidatus Doudnabacteria bacterium]